ncbi:MAG: tetratricopeptide repeat protein [Planctomycetes bacterium]|nr:tetratricopeptide repeat protein [Planctomycetota bacterium]
MGTGGISFRQLSAWAGAVCVAFFAGCRTSREADDLRSMLRVDDAATAGHSLVSGHRFGSWLEVEPDPLSTPALESACLLEQTGEREEAIAVLGEALQSGRESASVFEARGALYLGTGFPRAAAGDFQRAVALAPERPRCWYALGHAYEVLGLARQALEALEHARSLGCDDVGLFLSLARAYRALGRSGQSARHYQQVLTRQESPTELLAEAAVLASDDPARAASVDSLRERLESCRCTPLSDDAWFLRAILRELPGEPAMNIAAAFQALEVAPAELADLTASLLLSVQLLDSETSAEARAGLLAAEPDERRRAALERCLAPQ